MASAALQRKNMVESQVRPSDVTDRRITAAMMTVPRERFVPPSLASLAYSDESLVVAPGAVMLAPRLLAKLVQLAEVEEANKVLVVGGACGYAAAILAQLAAYVVAVLPEKESAEAASDALKSISVINAATAVGSPAAGWSHRAPYDVILIEGGIEAVPAALQAQLGEGGRLAAIGIDRGLGRAFVLHKQGGLITRREGFQASTAALPGFEAERPAFVF